MNRLIKIKVNLMNLLLAEEILEIIKINNYLVIDVFEKSKYGNNIT